MKKFIIIFLLLFLSSAAWASELDEVIQKAEAGDAEAQYELGMICSSGVGVEMDNVEALKWMLKSADQNLLAAQVAVGDMYNYGTAIPWTIEHYKNMSLKKIERDLEQAVYWYGKAAERGDAKAQYELAYIHEYSIGIYRNFDEALRLLHASASQGYPDAQCELGYLYFKGHGFEQNYVLATEWFLKAGKQCNYKAQYYLGEIYLNGYGIEPDYPRAWAWFKLAYETPYSGFRFWAFNISKGIELLENNMSLDELNKAKFLLKEIQDGLNC